MMYSALAMPSDSAKFAVFCEPTRNCIWTDGMFSE